MPARANVTSNASAVLTESPASRPPVSRDKPGASPVPGIGELADTVRWVRYSGRHQGAGSVACPPSEGSVLHRRFRAGARGLSDAPQGCAGAQNYAGAQGCAGLRRGAGSEGGSIRARADPAGVTSALGSAPVGEHGRPVDAGTRALFHLHGIEGGAYHPPSCRACTVSYTHLTLPTNREV